MSLIAMSRSRLDRLKPKALATPLDAPASVAFAVTDEGEDEAAKKSGAKKIVSDALSLVVSYVPVEIVSIYTVVLAALSELEASQADSTIRTTAPLPASVFWAFVVGTPLLTWLVNAVTCIEHDLSAPLRPKDWPWWEMAAATIAFIAWSGAMPGTAFARSAWYDPAQWGIVLVVVSTLLPLVGVIITRKPRGG